MKNKKLPKVITIVGPTAVGKTSLSVKLAKKIKGEIISADSMQAYKGMDIVSQIPTKTERKKAPHHLVGFLKVEDEYSASEFSKLARKKIKDIIKRKKIPIIVGGSGLYIKALIEGVFPSKGKDLKLRKKLEKIKKEKGSLFLHNKLKKIDPDAARKIHPNDTKRIIRAIEIFEVEKKTKTILKKHTKGIEEKYDIRFFGIAMDRKTLYERINKRVDSMFRKGLVKEVKKLLKKNLSLTSKKALGIKQVENYLKNEYDLEKAKDLLKRDTRRFAKRQLTWFRPDKRIMWIDIDRKPELDIIETIWKKLYS